MLYSDTMTTQSASWAERVPLFLDEVALHTAGMPWVTWCLPKAEMMEDLQSRTSAAGSRAKPQPVPTLHLPLLDPSHLAGGGRQPMYCWIS